MYAGRTLTDLAIELQRQREAKRDFIADTQHLQLVHDEGQPVTLDMTMVPAGEVTTVDDTSSGVVETFALSNHTHSQIASRIGIPKKYYDRMLTDAPDLLTHNVNHWFQSKPERRLVRTMDGQARAFLSDRYRRIDNAEILEAVIPALGEIEGIQIQSCEVTESRLYLKAITARQYEVKKGDVVQFGLAMGNSEVGRGSYYIDPLIFKLACLNGMIVRDWGMKKYHVGKVIGGNGDPHELFADDTMQADDAALFLKIRDIVKAAIDETKMTAMLERMQATTERSLEGNPVKAVEVLAVKASLSADEQGSVLRHLIEGGDLSQWGLINAVTRASQDAANYDRATELEILGGTVMELPKNDWRDIAQAA